MTTAHDAPRVEALDDATYRLPTEGLEADGTLPWDATTAGASASPRRTCATSSGSTTTTTSGSSAGCSTVPSTRTRAACAPTRMRGLGLVLRGLEERRVA